MNPPWTALLVPFDSSGADRGEERAPQAPAAAGLFDRLPVNDVRELDARLTDTRRDQAAGIIGYARVLEITETVYRAAGEAIASGLRPLVVGGDCGCIIGAVAAARDAHGRLGIAFVDAHLDAYDGETSPTGELADMDIAIITGRGDSRLVNFRAPAPICQPRDAIVIGYRVASSEELGGLPPEHLIADPQIEIVDFETVRSVGAATIAASALRRLTADPGKIWLHLDVDVFDAKEMPASSYSQDYGLGWQDVEAVARAFGDADSLVGLSVSDFTPNRDPDGAHARRLVGLLAAAFA